MKVEIRADNTARITGYVNVVERESRPVITPQGKVNEVIEQRAFEKAIEKSGNITVSVDHDSGTVYASTSDGTLQLYEDNIGLHADVVIKDEMVIDAAKKGKIRGWSFGMYNVVDEIEQRADKLPLRRVKDFMLDHITLVLNKVPCYSATSVELRADNEADIETRCSDTEVTITQPAKVDYTDLEKRINSLKGNE